MKFNESFHTDSYGVLIISESKFGTIKNIISEKEFTYQTACILFYRSLRGLQAIHNSKILHGDIKPENICVNGELNDPIPQIIDFGHAVILGEG
jgi:serine/threonine protein kinase